MSGANLDRRTALLGLAAATLPGAVLGQGGTQAVTWTARPTFAAGPLARNVRAASFSAPAEAAAWPEAIPLLGPDGPQPFARWRGKTLLVTLWAEWCAPCLAEMPAMARLNRVYGGRAFEILPIATGSKTLRSYADARDRLAALKGADIGSLVDGSRDGRALMDALASIKPTQVPPNLPPGVVVRAASLPCLLLVDPAGRLRGRALGGPGPNGRNMWDTPAADAFVKQLADGALAA